MITIDFVRSDDNVVEHRVVLDEDSEYVCLDHTMVGSYTVSVDDECRVLHQNGFDEILSEDSDVSVELTAGNYLVVADTDGEVPDWDALRREMSS